LTEQLPIPLFQLHQMIFRIGQDSPVYGPFYSILFYSILFYSILFYSILFYSILFYSILFYMVPVVVSLNLLQACDSTLIIMDWYQEDQVLGKRT